MADTKTYSEGLRDGLALYGRVCATEGSCDTCAIGIIKGNDITCAEFLKQFPNKALSILRDKDEKGYSYLDEFYTRHPECSLDKSEVETSFCCADMFGLQENDCPMVTGSDGKQTPDCAKCWGMKFGEINKES